MTATSGVNEAEAAARGHGAEGTASRPPSPGPYFRQLTQVFGEFWVKQGSKQRPEHIMRDAIPLPGFLRSPSPTGPSRPAYPLRQPGHCFSVFEDRQWKKGTLGQMSSLPQA